jgi:protein-tyrosine phosphatase
MKLQINRKITLENPYRICFVCLGNICRSPTAEGVLQHLVNKHGLQAYFEIDSAGTSAYHVGEPANSKSRQTAQKYGVALHSKARRFEPFDLEYFDLVLAMDRENLANINSLNSQVEQTAQIGMLRDFDPEPGDGEVPDPYYGGLQGFDNVFHIVRRSCQAILEELKPHIDGHAS